VQALLTDVIVSPDAIRVCGALRAGATQRLSADGVCHTSLDYLNVGVRSAPFRLTIARPQAATHRLGPEIKPPLHMTANAQRDAEPCTLAVVPSFYI
jgi:hypothetical protein